MTLRKCVQSSIHGISQSSIAFIIISEATKLRSWQTTDKNKLHTKIYKNRVVWMTKIFEIRIVNISSTVC